jgi:hypothetical protein
MASGPFKLQLRFCILHELIPKKIIYKDIKEGSHEVVQTKWPEKHSLTEFFLFFPLASVGFFLLPACSDITYSDSIESIS